MADVEILIVNPDFNIHGLYGETDITEDTETWPKSMPLRGRRAKNQNFGNGDSLASVTGVENGFDVEKPYSCNLCSMSFKRKPYLNVHLRTHTGERPYECLVCHKRFTQKSSLNTHMKVHTGERPYECDVCHKSFALKSHVAAHRWAHISKDMGCSSCGAAFASKTRLIAHVRAHAAPESHCCEVCGRRFLRSGFLARHTAQAHAPEVLEVTPTIQIGLGSVQIDYDDSTDYSDEG